MSSVINVTIKATDEASEVVAEAGRSISESMQGVESAAKQAASSQRQTDASAKDLAMGLSGLATSAFSLYNAFDRVQNAELSVDKATLSLQRSQQSLAKAQQEAEKAGRELEKAQLELAQAISRYGEGSKEAEAAQRRLDDATQKYAGSANQLKIAQDAVAVAEERVKQAEENKTKALISGSLQVLPTVITMIGSLSAVTQSWTVIQGAATSATGALSGALNFLAANPIVAVVAAIGLVVAGLVAAYNACPPFRDAINAIGEVLGGALSVAITAVYNGLRWLWDNVLVPLGKFVATVFIGYWNGLVAVWNALSAAVGAVYNGLKWLWDNVLVPLGKFVAGALLSAWNAFAGGLKWAYDIFIKPVVDALAWAYNNILKPVAGFFSGVGSALGGLGSAVSSGLSGLGKMLGLAEGGVVTSPTVALIGEAGPEAVVPLDKLQRSVNVGSQTLVLAPTFNFPEGSISQAQDPREFAEAVYEQLSRIVRSDLKAQTFFVPR